MATLKSRFTRILIIKVDHWLITKQKFVLVLIID